VHDRQSDRVGRSSVQAWEVQLAVGTQAEPKKDTQSKECSVEVRNVQSISVKSIRKGPVCW
jgi:hypothetical protein